MVSSKVMKLRKTTCASFRGKEISFMQRTWCLVCSVLTLRPLQLLYFFISFTLYENLKVPITHLQGPQLFKEN